MRLRKFIHRCSIFAPDGICYSNLSAHLNRAGAKHPRSVCNFISLFSPEHSFCAIMIQPLRFKPRRRDIGDKPAVLTPARTTRRLVTCWPQGETQTIIGAAKG